MKIIISARHEEITSEVKAHIEEKISAIFDGRPVKVSTIRVILDIEKKTRHIAEIIAAIKGHNMEVKEEAYNMYEAIDSAIDKLAIRVAKYLDKVQDHHKTNTQLRMQKYNPESITPDDDDDEFELSE